MGTHKGYPYAGSGLVRGIEVLGTHKGRPYAGSCPFRGLGWRRWVDEDDCVDVVWHDDELVQLDCRESPGKFTPGPMDHPSGLVQVHLFVDHVAKETQVFLHGDGHEVGADLCIVV